MKFFVTAFAVLFSGATAFAQAPQKMSYQAVIRNAANAILANTTVGTRISILQGSAAGTVVYQETQTPATNANGLISIIIGNGTVVSGNLSTIGWASNSYFLKTETDPAGGSSYTITGTSQMLSVPYAINALTASSAAPSGAAGGDLNGSTYPNPVIATGAVTGGKIATATIGLANLSATGTASATTFLRGDNSWAAAGSGTVTSVSAGNLTPVFTSAVATATTTPSITYTLSNAGAYTAFTNGTNATGAPAYGKIQPLTLQNNGGTASATTFYRGDGQWAAPDVVPNADIVTTFTAGSTYTVTDAKKTFFVLDLHGTAGSGAAITLSLLHPNSYAAGTVLTFSVNNYITAVPGNLILTSAAAGVKYTGEFNANQLSITSPSTVSLASPNNLSIRLMSNGVDTYYRLGL